MPYSAHNGRKRYQRAGKQKMYHRERVPKKQSGMRRYRRPNSSIGHKIAPKNGKFHRFEFQICISCCDQDYCNANVPINSTTAVYDDKITKMRMLAKNLFREREKALTTLAKQDRSPGTTRQRDLFTIILMITWNLIYL